MHVRAVIAAPARDDLFLLRPAEHVVVVPDDLDLRLVGVRPGQPEEDCAACPSRCQREDLAAASRIAGSFECAGIRVVIGERLRLLMDRLGDLAAAVADIDAIQSRERVDELLAITASYADPAARFHDARLRAVRSCVILQVSERMNDRIAIHLFQASSAVGLITLLSDIDAHVLELGVLVESAS